MNKHNNMVTVFTPTYNRAYRLNNLYDSLCKQSCFDFEWIIVDDGSTDNTESLVKTWDNKGTFVIKYVKQTNSGKYQAINRGVTVAEGELFFIVDSDDIIPPRSIETINRVYDDIKNDLHFGGLCGLKCYMNGEKVGGGENFGVLDCNSLDFKFKYKVKGDMAEVIRTAVMREFPFPDFSPEKFCPEALLFFRIASKYKLRYFYEDIYNCEYLPDGLTASIVKVRMKSPKASTTYYSELCGYNVPFTVKVKGAVNYWRFKMCMNKFERKSSSSLGALNILKPIGIIYHLYDKFKLETK